MSHQVVLIIKHTLFFKTSSSLVRIKNKCGLNPAVNQSCLVCVCMFCVDHVCTTTRSFFSTTSFCPCFVFRTKVNVCSPGSNPNTVKVTFPTPPANKGFQLQLVECCPVPPGRGCDCIRQSAGPTTSITQYWQQSRGIRGLVFQTLWKSIMGNIVDLCMVP